MNTPRRPIKPPRIGRKRRALGWTLLTLGLLVAGVAGLSGWWWVEYQTTKSATVLSAGRIIHTSYVRGDPSLVFGPQSNAGPGWAADRRADAGRRWVFSLGWRHESIPPMASSLGRIVVDDSFRRLVEVADIGRAAGAIRQYTLLLWPIPLLLWTPAALLLRSGILARRRAITGKCKKCGYDFAGLAAEAPCPECGKTRTA